MTTSEDWPYEYAHRLRWLGDRLEGLRTRMGTVRDRLERLERELARRVTARQGRYEPNDEVSE